MELYQKRFLKVFYFFITIFLFVVLVPAYLKAQHQEINENPNIWKGKENWQKQDTTTLAGAFKTGHFEGHLRYFFMATNNAKNLTDYFANAAGGGIRYETKSFKGFQFAVSGFFVFNIGSSDLSMRDSSTNAVNRYEVALFDVENPNNKKDIDRLEELYMKYNFSNTTVKFGRQLINTPFINLQDGRMRPTGVEGVWVESSELEKFKFEGGYLYAVSPRGTTKWFKMDESVGVYAQGVDENGIKHNYRDKINSNGVFLADLSFSPSKNLKFKAHNLYFENVFNAIFLQSEMKYPISGNFKLTTAIQAIRQDAINNGGNQNIESIYIKKGSKNYTYGIRIGLQFKDIEWLLNYNRIDAGGRYLMPREWGRDPFFTFMPRERNEGYADVHAATTSLKINYPKIKSSSMLTVGYYKMPDVLNFKNNKYGMPSYLQVNLDLRHKLSGALRGLESQLLIVGKINNGKIYDNRIYEINKVNMVLYNFVLNYYF